MTTMEGDAALRNLMNIFHQPLQQSPEKLAGLEDIIQNVSNGVPQFLGMPELSAAEPVSKIAASSSSGSVSPREDTGDEVDANGGETTATSAPNARQYRMEPWHECFTTTKESEFDALIYSVYVMKRDDRKLDGYEYYECINRLQSKCRYKTRAKKVNEFYIVEEKGAHNHAMEPVGSPGSHAGLPKTLREIVDLSFYNEWPNILRQQKIEEEVKRLGLPHNPRLGRQVDNRIAYLRRVKNLTETRKAQDQVAGMPLPPGMTAQLRPDMALNNANPEEILKFMMSNLNGAEDQKMLEAMISSQVAQPQEQIPPVSQPQIIVQENNNDLMNTILQQMNGDVKGEIPDQHIMSLLMSNGVMPPAPPSQAEVPMELEDSSSSSSPDDRLQIED